MASWHVLAPFAAAAGLTAIVAGIILSEIRRESRRWSKNPSPPLFTDPRDWYGQFMKDCKRNPRSWR